MSGAARAVPWPTVHGVTLMAVVNLNADSFSDPRTGIDLDERVVRARTAVAEGAGIVDLGAQSAALGAGLVAGEDQAAVLVPIVERLVAEDVSVSVDTYDVTAAAAVLRAGATILNDFSGAPAAPIIEEVVAADAWYVLTHNPVGPRRRQTDADAYRDVVDDTIASLTAHVEQLEVWGVPRSRLILDPGVDVGKTPAQTLALLRGRHRVRAAFDEPLLWAISRKDVIGALTGRPPRDRDGATLALLAAVAELDGCIVRMHEVAAAVDHLTVRAALAGDVDVDQDLLAEDLRRET